MDFDFYELYKDFSTTELLKIVHRPDWYQPEAVEAANLRLSERDIAYKDQAAVLTFYEESDRAVNQKAERIDQLKGQADDLLQPVLQPSAYVDPQKWLNLFLLMLGLQYSWTLIQTLIAVYKTIVLVPFGAGFGLTFLINIITLLYLPLFFYLLYKRKRWGWILVFAGILIAIVGVPVQIYAYSVFTRAMRHSHMDAGTIAWFAIQTLLKITFAVFLWRRDICDLFGVDQSIKIKTVLYTSVTSLLVFVGLLLLR